MSRRPLRHATPGQLCRIRPPVPSDDDAPGNYAPSSYPSSGHASPGATSGPVSSYETGPDGMIQEINDPVTVLTRFSGGDIDPLRFKWKNRVFDVDRVTGKWEEHDGQYKLHYFAVVTKEEDFYELIYNTRTMGWTLARTDLDGS